VRRVPRLLLKRFHDHALDILITDRARLARTRLVMQTIKTTPGEPARHLLTVWRAQPSRAAISTVGSPSAAANTIRQRSASACDSSDAEPTARVPPARAH
jgi:hypothetical protein